MSHVSKLFLLLLRGAVAGYESIYPMSVASRTWDSPVRAGDLEVRGSDLRLRYARSEDIPVLFALASDSEVTRYFSWGPYRQESEAAAYVASLAPKRAQGERLEFVIERREGEVIGVTGLSEFSTRDRRAVVGTWHGRGWWGTGANRGSKALVLALAFEGCGLERVTAWCGTDNGRSQTALERLGFVHEGVLRRWHFHQGEPRDVISYSMLREEWEASELAALPFEIVGEVPRRFLSVQS
jgi:ribosomal-protein-alanine N-acetyltransferase